MKNNNKQTKQMAFIVPMTCWLAFTKCAIHWLRAQDIFLTQWHPKELQKISLQTHLTYNCVNTAIMCISKSRQHISIASGAARNFTALPRRSLFVSIARLSGRRATTRSFSMLIIRSANFRFDYNFLITNTGNQNKKKGKYIVYTWFHILT